MIAPLGGIRANGLSDLLAARMILDTCKSIEEAKLVLLNNRVYFPFIGLHFLIYDKYGNSTIAEFLSKDDRIHFTDATNSIRVMTNHPVCLYPTPDTCPKPDTNIGYYDSFQRYKTLTEIASGHRGKFSYQDMIDLLRTVYAEVYYGSLLSENVKIPERTVINSLLDLTDGTILARYYLRDGPTDPLLGGPSNIFSKFFSFSLGNISSL
ncbi:MAG: carcinine hydrolase/isopenicillin-N N-acyltransferase family protein [Methanotrichaceae archaeon]